MYLLTFAMLVIGMLSIYTQVLAVQATRAFQAQSSIGHSMLEWQWGAMSLASHVMQPPAIGPGCSLTLEFIGPGLCQTGLNVIPPTSNAVVIGGGNYTDPTGARYPSILPGYDPQNVYKWRSIAFRNANGYFVMTYVDPPAGGVMIQTASPTQLGITQGDLRRQLRNIGVPMKAVGYIADAGGTLVTNAVLSTGGRVVYQVPAWVPPGSLGIIAQADMCTGC